MLKTNLSTRPFYNERAVHLAIAAAALAILALTVLNVTRVMALSRQNTELSSRMSHDEAEADRLTKEAAAIRRGIDKEELELVAAAAREANGLIDQRTFSWTAFFNYIEDTLPPDVMLVNVRPSVKNQQTLVQMTVVARRVEDVDEFIEKLEATGAFENVLPTDIQTITGSTPQAGLQRSVLQSVYTGPGAAEPVPAPAEPSAAAPAGEQKPGEAKPGEAKPGEQKPADQKPAEQKPADKPGNTPAGVKR